MHDPTPLCDPSGGGTPKVGSYKKGGGLSGSGWCVCVPACACAHVCVSVCVHVRYIMLFIRCLAVRLLLSWFLTVACDGLPLPLFLTGSDAIQHSLMIR